MTQPTESEVEAVARAIANSGGYDLGHSGTQMVIFKYARAAIAAMPRATVPRGPTEAMVEAGRQAAFAHAATHSVSDIRTIALPVWQAMHDAATKGET